MNAVPILALEGVSRRHPGADRPVLDRVDLAVGPGDRLAVVGPSGSGKSTLLFLLGLLDDPTGGVVRVDGVDAAGLDDDARARIRRERLGFVFQDHHLLPHVDALENVLVPWWADGRPDAAARDAARGLLDRVGLGDRLHHLPAQLSTGERQRVAVARALARRPAVILADEPTGALDPARAGALVDLLVEVGDAAVVMVTHDLDAAARLGRVLRLRGGRLEAA